MEKDGAFDRDRVLVYARKYFKKNDYGKGGPRFEHFFPKGKFRLIKLEID